MSGELGMQSRDIPASVRFIALLSLTVSQLVGSAWKPVPNAPPAASTALPKPIAPCRLGNSRSNAPRLHLGALLCAARARADGCQRSLLGPPCAAPAVAHLCAPALPCMVLCRVGEAGLAVLAVLHQRAGHLRHLSRRVRGGGRGACGGGGGPTATCGPTDVPPAWPVRHQIWPCCPAAPPPDACTCHMGPPPAAITHIHNTKMAELAGPAGRHAAAASEDPQQAVPQLRRAATDSVLDALRWVDMRSGGDVEEGGSCGAQRAAQLDEQGKAGPSATASGLAAAAAAWAATAVGTAAPTSSSVEGDAHGSDRDPQERERQQQLYWWQRWGWRGGTVQPAVELAQAPVGRGAASLRRCQSALDPLQHDSSQAGHVAVPINTRNMIEQAARGGQKSNSSAGGAGGAPSPAAAPAAAGGASPQEVLPYRLQAVGHSLGAATLLMYAVVCRMRGQPHRLRRLVLMSPAGFHPTVPLVRPSHAGVGRVPGWKKAHAAASLQRAAAACLQRRRGDPCAGARACAHPSGAAPCRACAGACGRCPPPSGCWTASLGFGGAAWACACPPRCCATSPSSSQWWAPGVAPPPPHAPRQWPSRPQLDSSCTTHSSQQGPAMPRPPRS